MSAPVIQPYEKDPTKLAFAIKQLGEGRSNATGTVTLTASDTTTTVTAPNCGEGNAVFMFPATASAAAVVDGTYVQETDVTAGQFIVTHPSDANEDKTFFWVALG